ncbi:hypothetical protein [Sphingopyxis sp. KK2]|uniref:hypothetical protein n=1 Tax=Sphingopyxis sp. KK2 TaxID=1855727 RepID=UPI0015C36130|nr:hypothetical protein [Sphingopyxis sp. KK2]
MIDRNIPEANDERCDRKDWSAPQLRSITPARRTRGGSGEANGDIDGLIYDLS